MMLELRSCFGLRLRRTSLVALMAFAMGGDIGCAPPRSAKGTSAPSTTIAATSSTNPPPPASAPSTPTPLQQELERARLRLEAAEHAFEEAATVYAKELDSLSGPHCDDPAAFDRCNQVSASTSEAMTRTGDALPIARRAYEDAADAVQLERLARGNPKFPKLRVGLPAASSDVDVRFVRAKTREHLGSMAACIPSNGTGRPADRGAVAVQVAVDANGFLLEVAPVAQSPEHAAIAVCIGREVSTWRLPPSSASTIRKFTLPIAFSAE
jgi:hypothetical protein